MCSSLIGYANFVFGKNLPTVVLEFPIYILYFSIGQRNAFIFCKR